MRLRATSACPTARKTRPVCANVPTLMIGGVMADVEDPPCCHPFQKQACVPSEDDIAASPVTALQKCQNLEMLGFCA